MKKILVLGIGGFSGRYFEAFFHNQCLGSCFTLVGADIDLSQALGTGSAAYRQIDATDQGQLHFLLQVERPDAILNLIGIFGTKEQDDYFRINLGITHHLFQSILALGLNVEKVVVIGSAAEYGKTAENPVRETTPLRPINLYGMTKAMQTELALYYHRVAGIPAVVARTFNLVGKGMSARLSIGSFMAQIAEAKDGGSISVGHIDTFRDFLTAETAVAAYWNLLTLSKPGEIYNICSGHPTLVRAMLDELMSQSGKHLSINVDPNRFKGDDIPAMFGDPSKYLALLAMNEESRR